MWKGMISLLVEYLTNKRLTIGKEFLINSTTTTSSFLPKKVKYFPADIEVFGMRIKDGQALPSDHVLTSLGKSSIQQLKTVKQLNSWKGLNKTLLSSLPNLANVMSPFDQAVINKSSKDPVSWTPQLI